ncbi:MAG TPA: peptide chain release factor N(5)-glutamine methyltransferase [Gemmatimonadaceae bacterium]
MSTRASAHSTGRRTADVDTIGDLVARVTGMLEDHGVADAAAEGRDLVGVVAGQSRFWPRVRSDAPADAVLVDACVRAAHRRAAGAPFAYAVRRAAFRHLTLEIDQSVLIPRQETELLVDLVLRKRGDCPGGVAADVCTGSGAIALALASEGRFDRVIGCDIATDALRLARRNAARLESGAARRLEFRDGDLLAPLRAERLDVLAANPPYIAFDEAAELPASVRDWEPIHALLSGGYGLDVTRRLVMEAPALVSSGGLLALEVDTRRAILVAEMVSAQGSWADVTVHQDLTGRERFVLAQRR